MKVFFIASQRGKKNYDKFYNAIYNLINEYGYRNLDDRLIKNTYQSFYERIKEEGDQAFHQAFQENMKFLKQADINVFECSIQSFSIGYMVQKSLEQNKPTIVLYQEEQPPYFLLGAEEEKLMVRGYNEENIRTVVKKALDDASVIQDKRFNFFISPALLNYLNNAAREDGITKSTFIRNLLIEHRRNKGR